MIVAFTGSAQVLTLTQRHAIEERLWTLPQRSLIVTGGCVGVDAAVAEYAYGMGHFVVTILPENRRKVTPDWRDFCHIYEDSPRDYRARNTRMVELCELLIGFPEKESDGRDIGSGSWMTIRIAKRMGREVEVYPLSEIDP